VHAHLLSLTVAVTLLNATASVYYLHRRTMALACARSKDTEGSNAARQYLEKTFVSLENLALPLKTVENLKNWLQGNRKDKGINSISLRWAITFLTCAAEQRVVNIRTTTRYVLLI